MKPLRRNLLISCVLGLSAFLLVWLLWFMAPGLLNSWEWSAYDARLGLRGPAPASPALVIIGRDADSDARFGVGIWDRARFARVIAALGQAGAAVVAPDFHFAGASPPERGGPASDAALIGATTAAGNVVYPVLSSPLLPGLAERARGVGHVAALPDEDGVYRSMPAPLTVNGQAVPAFGVAVTAAFLHTPPETLSVPVDRNGRLLINYAGRWAEGPFPYVSFVDVWDAVEEGRVDELRRLVSGKIVLLLQASLESDKRRTPLELNAPGGFIHANVIHTLVSGSALREIHPMGRVVLTVTLAVVSAWLLLSVSWWTGLSVVGVVGVLYVGLAQVFLAVEGVVLPVLPPLFGLVCAAAGAMVWTSAQAVGRIRTLERDVAVTQGELAATRETLAGQELTVERLEDDLDAARDEAALSGQARQDVTRQVAELTARLEEAQQCVEATRRAMQHLETRLADLSVVPSPIGVRLPVGALLSDAGLEALRQECGQLGIVTQDATVLATFRDVKKAAQSTATILLWGETGTGKELFARAVHTLSRRAEGPFVLVNMAAMPAGLVESALFGHVRGAFTGAIRDHKGLFEQAHRGTIFLDEIGDLPLETQAKMLRVLQDGTFDSVGATRPTTVDVRVVSATNKDLRQEILQRRFREDLYFRLKGIDVRLPPLRERRDDVPLLAERFLCEAAMNAGRQGLALSHQALDALRRGTWPGNIRDLKNCIERACVMADGAVITEQDLRLDSRQGGGESLPAEDVSGDQAVLACLRRHGFDMQATAQALGRDRSTVTQRLKGLCFRALAEHQGDRRAAAEALAGDVALARIVGVKLSGYYGNLLELAAVHQSAEEAVAAVRRRFKNLPERHRASVETLTRRYFEGTPAQLTASKISAPGPW